MSGLAHAISRDLGGCWPALDHRRHKHASAHIADITSYGVALCYYCNGPGKGIKGGPDLGEKAKAWRRGPWVVQAYDKSPICFEWAAPPDGINKSASSPYKFKNTLLPSLLGGASCFLFRWRAVI